MRNCTARWAGQSMGTVMKQTPHKIFVAVVSGVTVALLADMMGRLIWIM